MEYILEFFDFLKKQDTWQNKFDNIYKIYQKNKTNYDLELLKRPHADIQDDNFSVALGLTNHLAFYADTGKGNHNLDVVDFDICEYDNPKSNKGVYKITQAEYDSYKKKCQEISDWLDDISEHEYNKSGTTIGSGEIDLDFDESDLAEDEINHELKKKVFNTLIGKEFEFEVSYHLWTSESSNANKVERYILPIKDINVKLGGGRFYAQVATTGPLGENCEIWLESDSNSDYYDLESNKFHEYDKIIRMDIKKKELSRKGQREEWKNKKYPFVISYVITPCKYDSTEFIKSITEVLSQLNDQLENKKS